MKSFFLKPVTYAWILLFSCTCLSCSSDKPEAKPFIDPSFGVFVSSYTSGTISAFSSIVIRLANEVGEDIFNKQLPEDLFSFSPGVEGETIWIDKQTVEFKPSESLKPGSNYTVKFNLGKLVEVPEDKTSFEYLIKTLAQNFDLKVEKLLTTDLKTLQKQDLVGIINTADLTDEKNVEKIIHPTQNGDPLNVVWDHASDGITHRFTVKDIARKEKEQSVLINVNGEPIGTNKADQIEIKIPALDDFKLIDSYVEQKGEQHIVLRFSDPLSASQKLTGLIQVEGLDDLKFDIQNNEIHVFPSVRQTGSKKVALYPGIKNVLEKKLGDYGETTVHFEQLKPGVRFTGKGNIIPGEKATILPFEAVSLKAVEVTVIRVYEENIAQFYQVNHINDNREIQRVGRPVLKKVVRLDEGLTDLTRWSRFSLDLSELIKVEPGAIYQVKLGFRKPHQAYFCDNLAEETEADLNMLLPDEEESWDNYSVNENSYWDYYDEYYYSDDYDWSERENPCSDSYYGDRRSVKKNVFASNIGVITKKGTSNNLMVVATDLTTTDPLNGAKVEILDYQKKLLAEVSTNSEGIATATVEHQPFLVVVSYNNQKGYLRIDDGSSLSMSHFDTRGQTVEKGIKGFIYGERGVWRPGDSLYLSFILEDKDNNFPEDHPVVLELNDPQGKLTKRVVRTSGLNGIYRFDMATEEDAPTGNYSAKVRVGGATFRKTIKIETVKPNRLKINFDNEKDIITASDPQINAKLKVNWLHGAPGGSLKAEFDVDLSHRKTTFDKYQDFTFDDVSRTYYGEQFSVFKGTLDKNGEAEINYKLKPKNDPPGALNLRVSGKVYEKGGDFSIKNFSIPFYSYEAYTGIKTPKGDQSRGMLLTDTSHTVQIVTVTPEGGPIVSDVEVSLYKIEWKWWWDNSEFGANYISSSLQNRVAHGRVTTLNGKGEWKFRVNKPDWGRFYVKACNSTSGHCTGKVIYIDWPGWAGRAQRENPGGASMLSFSTDKSEYTLGEKIQLNIPGSDEGRALISIENGRKVVSAHWINTIKGENSYFIETTPEMAPGVYINVTIVQKHAQTANDLPIRMYGVVPVMVTDPSTKLSPEINMPEVLTPGQKVAVKISEATGKPMTYTVAVVDEGLLDLTNFNTPDPWSDFYKREALGVKSFDLYDDVMGAYGGKLERILAIGGDGDLNLDGDKNNLNRFKPVVKYFGPFTLNKGQTNTLHFIMPEYVGSVKTMVVAAESGAYGSAEHISQVKKPLMVLGTLPRVVGPGEKVSLPVNVFAMDDKIKNVDISIKVSDLFKSNTVSQKVSFQKAGDQLVNFQLDVANKLGQAFVEISAKSGNHTATHRIDIAVRNPNPPITSVIETVLKAKDNWTTDYKAPGMEGTNTAYLEVSSIPPIDLTKRLQYLIQYPHGCIEQTVSSVFPQLYVMDIIDISEDQKKNIQNNVKAAIARLQQFQSVDGGFTYWPGLNVANEWGSNYAGHFLLEAKRKGYSIPGNMLRNWKKFQSKVARSWRKKTKADYEDLIQAYRLYTLALEGNPETGAMNRLREESVLSLETRWRLAAAYSLAGQNDAANALTQNAGFKTSQKNEYWAFTYGSQLRDEAMILETLGIMKEFAKAAPLMKSIAEKLSSSEWMSTQTTAYSLIAIGRFLEYQDKKSGLDFNYTINGKKGNAKSELSMVRIPIDANKVMAGKVSVSNSDGQIIYPRIIMTGTPARGTESSEQRGISTQVVYKDAGGKSMSPDQLSQGSNFTVEVTVSNFGLQGNLKDLALTQIFPSGWEILNHRLSDADNPSGNTEITYQDIRDDRVYTYFDLNRGEKKTFIIQLNASYLGDFYLPAVKCEAMYDHTVFSIEEGKNVTVYPAGVRN